MDVRTMSAGAVVAAVDGSPASLGALRWATDQAVLAHRPLSIVHAAPSDGLAVVERACAEVDERHRVLEVRCGVFTEDPRAVLLDASEHASVVVVGSRGRGPVTSLLLGSVGVALTQHARCPVVVRRPQRADARGLGILVGTDGVRHSEPAVDWAYRQAALRGMPLTLVRTFVEDSSSGGGTRADEPGHEALRAQLDAVAQQFSRRHPSVEVTLRLERGLAGEALGHAAADMDTVVVGTHVRRSVLRVLEADVTTRLVETAQCCVVVVPASDG